MSQRSHNHLNLRIRQAIPTDVPRLREIIEASVRGLQTGDYSPSQLEGALKSVYGVDSQLIADGTYFVAEISEGPAQQIVACGGWSKRKTLYGGDQYAGREDSLLDPAHDAAKIRAFFVHPDWARRGIGTAILEACENAAVAAGFAHLEMGATLSGVTFYRAKGYVEIENQEVALGNGEVLPIVRMAKEVNVGDRICCGRTTSSQESNQAGAARHRRVQDEETFHASHWHVQIDPNGRTRHESHICMCRG